MASSLDVAQYILDQRGSTTTIKLQKLVYYSQAWSLVWDEKPLFEEDIQAWANGPVVPRLFDAHRGKFETSCIAGGDPSQLNANQKQTVDIVLGFYGDKSAQWLVELTHMEEPWRNARGDCKPGDLCRNVITQASMAEYYIGLYENAKG